jgi:hypothetical protein
MDAGGDETGHGVDIPQLLVNPTRRQQASCKSDLLKGLKHTIQSGPCSVNGWQAGRRVFATVAKTLPP